MAEAKLLVSIGAEGGSIALYGDVNDSMRHRFRLMIVDQTPMFLDDDQKGAAVRRDSGWLSSWTAAMEALGRYPWPNLSAMYVDPSVANDIWQALQDYVERTGRTARDSALNRWRVACGQFDK